jgi:hypothetical protein
MRNNYDSSTETGGKTGGPGILSGQAHIPGNGDMGHEKRRVWPGRNGGMAGIGKTAYRIGEAGMKIIIGGQDIEVPRFMAEAMKNPENDRQFHAFLRRRWQRNQKKSGERQKKSLNP